ncbi:MAG: DUF1648 domain-containing protein [Coprococcus sp.]|nr:DUF1648 domain-containing protein [Coprococcus sp.]
MKEYRRTLIITSLITVSPILFGLTLWNRMPDVIATHFGGGNVPNGWSSKGFAVFGLPIFMLIIHLLCCVSTLHDPKRKNIENRYLRLLMWCAPLISVVCCVSIYAAAIGKKMDIGMIVDLLVGITFVIFGNYMHKIKQNYTVGIKLPWTLASEENWNRTHRLASWFWVLGGMCFIADIFLPIGMWIFVLFIPMAVMPVVYSFILYRKGI